ncbi:MAG: Arc family DNA-binding protein [Gemmatimonadetes bacterium]|nr:Arc family DNA-binding protein [Gemmatimonadota bacterium]MYH52134.1 Arc family DNA-binding protein [Gemmatimonadota bacterium]
MPDLVIRGIPDELHRELKTSAERNHRSLNGEIRARLAASVRPGQVDAIALLERIQRRHRALGPVDLAEATLPRLRDEARTRWSGGE